MPLRDADLREAAVEHEIRPGDPGWRLLVELQERRDRDRRRPPRPEVPVLEREGRS